MESWRSYLNELKVAPDYEGFGGKECECNSCYEYYETRRRMRPWDRQLDFAEQALLQKKRDTAFKDGCFRNQGLGIGPGVCYKTFQEYKRCRSSQYENKPEDICNPCKNL